MYSKKNKAEIKSVAKKTRQGQGRNSVPKRGKKKCQKFGKRVLMINQAPYPPTTIRPNSRDL